MKSKTVAIIGAGACGLVSAKVLLDDGFHVTLFEQKKTVGGVWSPEFAYLNLHTQQPGGTYEFSDLFHGEEYAPWENVHNYLQKYADLFHIIERIQFQTRVISISKEDLKNDRIPWIIQTENIINNEKQTNQFDFVIVSTGLCSEPYLPNYKGQNKFSGSILPPTAIKSSSQLENKRVIVVGCAKCAFDMATLAGRYAHSCHMIFRQAHWMLPRKLKYGLTAARLIYTRASSFSHTPVPDAPHTNLFRFIHKKFPETFTAMSDRMSNDVLSALGSDYTNDKIFIPSHPFRNVENPAIMAPDFIQLKREGRIIGKLGVIDEIIDETTVRLNTGEELQADMIISATGYVRRFPFFSEKDLEMMGLTTSNGNVNLNLYRRLLPVGIPNIAFIGFAASVSNWMVGEVASHWISDYFLGRIKLPNSEEKMTEEIKTHNKFIKTIFNRNEYHYRYYWKTPIDIFLNDMGLSLHRTSNWISEYFGIYRPERFKGLSDERRIIAETGDKPYRFYFSFQSNIILILFLILVWLFIVKIFF